MGTVLRRSPHFRLMPILLACRPAAHAYALAVSFYNPPNTGLHADAVRAATLAATNNVPAGIAQRTVLDTACVRITISWPHHLFLAYDHTAHHLPRLRYHSASYAGTWRTINNAASRRVGRWLEPDLHHSARAALPTTIPWMADCGLSDNV